MQRDRYGNELSTASTPALDAYQTGIDLYLSSNPGVEVAFELALKNDPDFVAPLIALARQQQTLGYGRQARETIAKAEKGAGKLSDRERSHLGVMTQLIHGKSAEALDAARVHLSTWPRDILIAQTCLGVFSLIGFSGQPGREAEQLAFTTSLLPHYGDDWCFLAQHAFAQMETGQTGPAETTIERAITLNARNANAAHIRAHLYYENGETDAGLDYLTEWNRDYDKQGLLHCHISWHIALWALERGDEARMWQVIDENVTPGGAWGPPLNVMTDMAAVLYRAELAGVAVAPERWQEISEYAAKWFPKPALGFADVHAALAHAMAGNGEALERIIADAKGPAADVVTDLASAFKSIASEDWTGAENHLTAAMIDHARIGGSRAQRDLVEFAMANTLLKQGKAAEARRLLAIRRPHVQAGRVVAGLQ